MKEIKITCRGQKYLPIDQLKNFQGDLKELREDEYEKLKKSILKYGFSFPVFVWQDFMLDGHQRIFTVNKLLAEGYIIGDIPVVEIEAKDKTEAAEKLLVLNSHYAKITEDGLYGFINEMDVDFKGLADDLVLPDFDMDDFFKGYMENDEFLVDEDNLKIDNETINEIKDLDDLAPTDEEWKELEGKLPIIEFSGGKDSSATVVWAFHFLKVKPILIYCSLGVDHPSLWQHLFDCADFFECELKILNSPVSFFDVLKKKGWPNFRYPWCKDLMDKIVVEYLLKNYEKGSFCVLRGGRNTETFTNKPNVKRDRINTIKQLAGHSIPWKTIRPFAFCSKKVCEEVLFSADVPIWSGYNYGLGRTACWMCPGQRTITYAALRRNYPDLWEVLLKWESKLGPGAWQANSSFNILADKGSDRLNKSCCLKRSVKRIF